MASNIKLYFFTRGTERDKFKYQLEIQRLSAVLTAFSYRPEWPHNGQRSGSNCYWLAFRKKTPKRRPQRSIEFPVTHICSELVEKLDDWTLPFRLSSPTPDGPRG
ncbi:hypothetical protein AMECASPLE_002464 [Ameca splendens]|uniref:Uncharacterized protein n=1 Tax=Ameca splendens TaxID=208324 RepID=A0ABV0YXX5_9TELE